MSGFQGIITLPVTVKNENVQIVHRFSNDAKTGEGSHVDFWSEVMPVKDSFQKGNGPLKQFGLQTINGHQYYIDPMTGQPRKNFLLQNGNDWLYFDNETGEGTNALKMQFDGETISADSQYRKGNEAYGYDNKSIENVDGFLTADTWYRPKQILKNGTTWTDSKETDMRPLLMVWWPNTVTQAYYLNYMKQHGNLLPANLPFFNSDADPLELNYYAEIVQQNIEKKISQTGNTDWLRTLMHEFVSNNTMWNKNSENEDFGGLQLQGGFLKYVNSDKTPNANSNWRIMGRQPANIDGNGPIGSEFLLANDVDNSNPVVQAEQLNWLHYLLNFGTITANDPDANFDSIRVDAVDNVDADLLDIAGDYFNAVYHSQSNDKIANAHINILEDWGGQDPYYTQSIGTPQLSMDYNFSTIRSVLASNTASMTDIIKNSLVNRSLDNAENVSIPNYSFIRAHDNGSQDDIKRAISDVNNLPYGSKFNFEQEQKGIEAYIADQSNVNKKWNNYNIPSSYAIMLTNKDTVPRVYYGDLFTDGGQYMAQTTRYYPALTSLLKARIKYVAGGQTMSVDKNNILTSVRFGKGAMNPTDMGDSLTRTSGVGVVISNNDKLLLSSNDKVVLHMGAAHKNQKFKAVLLTTNDGIQSFNDDNAPVAYTDANGDLVLSGKDITTDGVIQHNTAVKGYANADVKGYLAVWVPVGASVQQDIRTAPSGVQSDGKSVYHSNAALDSNIIFEGFSNFVYWPTNNSERANVKIAQNTDLFKELGITSFELAPQYNSSKDGTFLDSQIDNGYAFTDRYDLGMSIPNKYGSDTDLRNAIKALHKAGIQAMADWVPDQIYNLPGKEVVTATRVDERGNDWNVAQIKDSLYVANTIGGGKYQEQYGGAFLDQLQKQYPQIFERKQPSTGVAIDPSTKIKQWSAKYFNGTNILHRGAGYVLRDNGGIYFSLGNSNNKQLLPNQLSGKAENGFVDVNGNTKYFTSTGIPVTDAFVQDSVGNWYYIDKNGNMLKNTGFVDITRNGQTGTYLFLNNGISFRSGLVKIGNDTYYFDGNGKMVRGQSISDGTMNYTLDKDGKLVGLYYDPSSQNPHPITQQDLSGTNK